MLLSWETFLWIIPARLTWADVNRLPWSSGFCCNRAPTSCHTGGRSWGRSTRAFHSSGVCGRQITAKRTTGPKRSFTATFSRLHTNKWSCLHWHRHEQTQSHPHAQADSCCWDTKQLNAAGKSLTECCCLPAVHQVYFIHKVTESKTGNGKKRTQTDAEKSEWLVLD